mgnify:CR=1 FL=1
MPNMTVTRNGQLTIPKEMREHLDIEDGTPVVVNMEGDRVVISKKKSEWDDFGGWLPEDFKERSMELRRTFR